MSYRRREQLHRAARRAARPGRQPNPAGRRDAAPLPPAAVRSSRSPIIDEPERDGAPSPRQGLDWARRTELAAIVLGVLLSPLITAAGLWYANDQVRDQLSITQEGQITDRYTKAVENLGNDAMDVRLGGVYALQRIMQDSPRDHPTIANVLNTYIRTHADKAPKKGGSVPADVHAALTVLVQRDATRDQSFYLDLRKTHLPGIELHPREKPVVEATTVADLSGANLSGADLTGANLPGANLTGANLTGANLTGAALYTANLSDAILFDANLSGAILSDADLAGANLSGADLTSASLFDANLSGAILSDAILSDAILSDADLTGANLTDADLTGANLTDANLTGANLTDANLSRTQGLRTREVITAVIDSRTKLPWELVRDPAVKARIAQVEKQRAGADHPLS